ncbi:MAG TPA: UDP-3-O-(3-hydroxymyristoyl)glucosamine N-acyltransferase, partial [bacterium (Candidatus Stahlbacteria)]|nr:UDP-3-O-(3-hydroxymyristoyl)glucosamine N-acyltransferase [Candidatus Stahlbacteria bacterium]
MGSWDREVTAGEIAKLVGGKLRGDPSVKINDVARLPNAKEGEITYLAHPRYKRFLATTKASCIIVPKGFTELKRTVIEVEDPDLCFIKLINFFHKRELPPTGIDRRATIGKNVNVGKDVAVGALTYIENDVEIGDKVIIFPCVYIGKRVRIGERSIIYPNATIRENVVLGKNVIIGAGSVIGSDGFGYIRRVSNYIKIPQVGGVIVEDDVEIGANVTIDRGSLGNTIIKRGTKIDNLVHIAHNVVIGENSIVVAQ